MSFLWPQVLWLLLALPLLPAAYVLLLRVRRRAMARHPGLLAVPLAGGHSSWQRHGPPAMLLAALCGLLVAAGRPVALVRLPHAVASVVLALDTSLSMQGTDVEPTRLAAAQRAALAFLQVLPRAAEVGLVTFADTARVVQRLTPDRGAVATALETGEPEAGTAIGNAIVLCLSELFPDQRIRVDDAGWGGQAEVVSLPVERVAPGSHASAAIVLLSDGHQTHGVGALVAAAMAADRGVRIHAVGLVGAGPDTAVDEDLLREVARITGGEYHRAGTAQALRAVYRELGWGMRVQRRETELTALLTLASALLAAAAAVLSLWEGRDR